MARLIGPNSFGLAPEEALDQASAPTKLAGSDYEKLRVRASRITESLSAGKSAGAERAGLYCERADAYEQLARAHRADSGPALASRPIGNDDPAAAAGSVFLLAAPNGNDYDVLGAGFLIRTEHGPRLVTDAAIVRGQKKLLAFSRPQADGALGRPYAVRVERAASGAGAAIASLEENSGAPALALADASPAVDELVTGLGPLRLAGPWSVTQGLVTRVGTATFSSDAILGAEMAGSPVLNDRGEAAGIVIRRGKEATALKIEKLRAFLDGEETGASGTRFIASVNSGSASLLTEARPADEYPWSAPGGSLKWGGEAQAPGPSVAKDMPKLFGGIYAQFSPPRSATPPQEK
jgi:hypothetical protein